MLKNNADKNLTGARSGSLLLSRSKKLWLSIILSFLCATLLCMAFLLPLITHKNSRTASAATYSGATNIGNLYNYDIGGFEKSVLNSLAKKAGYADIDAMVSAAESQADSSTLVKKSNGFGSATLNLGRYFTATEPTNLEWIPVALSKGDNGHAILTLWLSHTDIHGVFNKSWNSVNNNPPSNMYGTSYIRNVINNYGESETTYYYYHGNTTSATTLTKEYYTPQTSNVVSSNVDSGALFYDLTTDSNLNIKNYIVTPNQLGWQTAESTHKNDPANTATYYTSDNWSLWQNDLLWIPSVTETGMSTAENQGLWATSQAMRMNIGTRSTWTRSGNVVVSRQYHTSYALTAASGAEQDDPMVTSDYSVRPAFHLDLTEVAAAAKTQLAVPDSDVEPVYNGDKQSLSTLTTKPDWYSATVYEDTDIIAKDDEFTDVSENEVTVTLISDKYYWSDYKTNSSAARTFNFNIKSKKLEVTFEDNGGCLVATYDETQLYERDKSDEKKPKIATKYSKTNTLDGAFNSPNSLGNWYAIAVLENACNYHVDAKQSFNLSKMALAVPKLSDSCSASVTYNGAEQTFTFEGFDGGYMSCSVSDGAVSFDGETLTVKAPGSYTVEYSLTNTAMCEWADSSTKEKTVTVTVEKKELETEFVDKGGLLVAEFKDETEIYDDDKNVGGKPKFTLTTKYSKNGVATSATYTRPDSAGVWYAHAFIDEDCNYFVSDAGEQFTLSKMKVAYPAAADPDALEQTYDGEVHEIILDNYLAKVMVYRVPDNAEMEYDSLSGILKVKVTKSGEYTVNFSLANTSLYEWESEEPVIITITPKNVQINADEDNPDSWEKDGSTKELKFTVPTALCGDDSSLNLVAVCTKNGSEQKPAPAVAYADGEYIVTVPAYSRGNYSLVVKVADGENYAGSSEPVTFEITGVGIDIGYNDIVWKIDGKGYTVADETDAAEVEYSGNTFTVTVDFSANEYAADLQLVGTIDGDWADATDVGEYTATARIASSNAEYIFDKEFTLTIKIVAKKLTFDDAEWQWQYTGDSEWNALTDDNMPGFENKAVAVRLSPDYLLSLGLEEGDYTLDYHNHNDMTERGDKSTSVEITVSNANFTTEDDGYIEITKNWKIGPKALKYGWTAKQTLTAGDNSFNDIPAIVFDDGNDYSQYFEYYFTVDGDNETEYSKEQLEEYISGHWSETVAVTGKVYVRMLDGDGEVVISESHRSFSTGTPKTGLEVVFSGEGGEYGNVDFSFSVLRGGSDESAKTSVTVSGPDLEEDKTFDGDSEEFKEFLSGLGVGSYTVTVSVTEENKSAYTITNECSFTLEIAKRKVSLPTLKKDIIYSGDTIYFKDCVEGFDGEIMKIVGEEEEGTDCGVEWREDGYFTKIVLLDESNYEFADTEGAAEYEYNWMIEKFRITDDMWKKDAKDGAVLELPDWAKDMLSNSEVLEILYTYFNDEQGEALEEVVFTEGGSFFVSAALSGSAAANFEFESGNIEDGRPVSARTSYTIPENKVSTGIFTKVGQFVKDNKFIVIGVAAGLLLLLALIIILSARRKRAAYGDGDYDDDYDYDDEEDDYDSDYDDGYGDDYDSGDDYGDGDYDDDY